MEFIIGAVVWVLMIIVPIVGLILTIWWVFERASTALRAMFGLFGYLVVVLPLYFSALAALAANFGGH